MTYFKSKPCSEYGCSRPIFSNKLCKYHAAIKSLNSPKKKVVSDKKKEREQKYLEARSKYFQEVAKRQVRMKPVCEVEGCEEENVECHHKAGRIGNNLFKYLMVICRKHHLKCDTDPNWAYENGYSLKRNYKYD